MSVKYQLRTFSMKFSFLILFFLTIGAVRTDGGDDDDEDDVEEVQKRFKVVSEYSIALKFYPEIRAQKTKSEELLMELKYKKAICRDIINSHYIKQRLSYYLHYEVQKSILPFRKFEALHLSPWKLLLVTLGAEKKVDENFLEWVFVCPVKRKPAGTLVEAFYISEEYRIGGNLRSADNYIAGRFIFRFFADRIRLAGLAETTAKIVLESTEEIENTYIERRKHRDPESEIDLDPLCASKPWEKIRICTAVFTASYFNEQIDYPTTNWVDGGCMLRTVSFQMENHEVERSTRHYEEWMMDCNPYLNEEKPRKLTFLLSQAYKSNEIFVHSVQRDQSTVYLEGRAVNIRFTV